MYYTGILELLEQEQHRREALAELSSDPAIKADWQHTADLMAQAADIVRHRTC